MNEVIEREAVFQSGLFEQGAWEGVGDDIAGHDDVIGDAAVIFGVAVAHQDVVKRSPPEGFVGVGSHHHFVRETEESGLPEEAVHIGLRVAALVGFRLSCDDEGDSGGAKALQSDGIPKDGVLGEKPQQTLGWERGAQVQLVAAIVILLIHHVTELVIDSEFGDMAVAVELQDMVLTSGSNRIARCGDVFRITAKDA